MELEKAGANQQPKLDATSRCGVMRTTTSASRMAAGASLMEKRAARRGVCESIAAGVLVICETRFFVHELEAVFIANSRASRALPEPNISQIWQKPGTLISYVLISRLYRSGLKVGR